MMYCYLHGGPDPRSLLDQPGVLVGGDERMRKSYCKPEVRAERLSVGVFGNYGCDYEGILNPFIGIFNPLFKLCCGG